MEKNWNKIDNNTTLANPDWPISTNETLYDISSNQTWYILSLNQSTLIAQEIISNNQQVILWSDYRDLIVWPTNSDISLGKIHRLTIATFTCITLLPIAFYHLYVVVWFGLACPAMFLCLCLSREKYKSVMKRIGRPKFPWDITGKSMLLLFVVCFYPIILYYFQVIDSVTTLFTTDGSIPGSVWNTQMVHINSVPWLHDRVGYLQFLW